MKENYNKSIKLNCIACGDSDFEQNINKTWLKCNRCNREYLGGYDELVRLNTENIDKEVEKTKNEVLEDLGNDINKMLKNILKK